MKSSTRNELLRHITTPEQLIGLLDVLPDPDPVLRRAGTSHAELYNVMRDPHVISELRTLRAGLLDTTIVLNVGSDDATSKKSHELVSAFFRRQPAAALHWGDIDWHNYSAILHGSAVTMLDAYERSNGRWLPSAVRMWSNAHIQYTDQGELRVITSDNNNGEPAHPQRFTCVKHMVSATNPYGIALLSSAWWLHTLKKIGQKKFGVATERYGLPMPIAKHPVNATDAQVDALLDSIIRALEDGVIAIPDDSSIDLVALKGSGEPLPKLLADWCNKELTKLFTSQTLATEQGANGARAAAETHQKRTEKNVRADRQLAIDARNQIARAIHETNFDGGEPPTFTFNEPKQITSETVSRVKATAAMVQVPEWWVYESLGAPRVEDGDTPFTPLSPSNQTDRTSKNNANFSETAEDWDGFDEATNADVLAIKNALDSAEDLHDFQAQIESMYPGLNTDSIALLNAQTQHDYLHGATTDD